MTAAAHPVITRPPPDRHMVAIVTGAASATGREVARGLAGWEWALVVVYLDNQRAAEAAVAEILAVKGTVVAVRADLGDDLDVQRVFTETHAAFGGVDAVVHATTDGAAVLFEHAVRNLRPHGIILSIDAANYVTPPLARQLRERAITLDCAPPSELLAVLDRWRRHA